MEALIIMLVIACFCDYLKGKIPNVLLAVMLFAGIGQANLLLFVLRCITVMLLLYPIYKIGAIGAGDVKLYGVCAGYLPSEKFLFFFFLSLLIAAVISLIKMIRECNAIERLSYFFEYIVHVVKTGRFYLYVENERERKRVSVCLAGPILGSVLLYMGGVY